MLLLGESGSGKSDLALRLIGAGALLVADDRVDVTQEKKKLRASPPPALCGKLEVRGVGILELPYQEQVPLALAISLVTREQVERLPDPQFFDCLGQRLPLLSLHAFDSSTVMKIRLALQHQE